MSPAESDDEFTAVAEAMGSATGFGAGVLLDRGGDDTRTVRTCNVLRAVCTAVVSDQHFAIDAGLRHVTLRLVDTRRDRLGLVEAGHEYGQFTGWGD